MLVLLGTSIGTGLQIPTKMTNERGDPTTIAWFENFDDGDISDWTILNPEKPGDQNITLELTTNQSHSPQYSMLWDSPHTGHPDYSARAYGPNVALSLDQPHTIEFWFRWNDFHWVHLVSFGYLDAKIDYPSLKMFLSDDDGYHYLGNKTFSTYCPRNTWTHFKFQVEPSISNITLYANDNFIFSFHYKNKTPDVTKFNMRDPGAGADDYFDHCYYDDIKVEGTSAPIYITILSPQQNLWYHNNVTISGEAHSDMGTIINVSLQIDFQPLKYATINGINWNYVWDSTKGTDGEHTIIAYCQDSSGNTEHSFPITVIIDNKPPQVILTFPPKGKPCIFGHFFTIIMHFIPNLNFPLIVGPSFFGATVTDNGTGVTGEVEYHFYETLFHTNVTFWAPLNQLIHLENMMFGPVILTVSATDKIGNTGTYTYPFIKIL